MKRWKVETRVTSLCIYFVDAEDEKAAEAASCDMAADYSEDENEETMAITEVTSDPSAPTPSTEQSK